MNGFYFEFKLHVIINDNMDIVAFKFTKGSVSDIAALDNKMVEHISGYLIGDKGYISREKAQKLRKNNINLITRPRKNMKKLPVSKKNLNLIKNIFTATLSIILRMFSSCFLTKLIIPVLEVQILNFFQILLFKDRFLQR